MGAGVSCVQSYGRRIFGLPKSLPHWPRPSPFISIFSSIMWARAPLAEKKPIRYGSFGAPASQVGTCCSPYRTMCTGGGPPPPGGGGGLGAEGALRGGAPRGGPTPAPGGGAGGGGGEESGRRSGGGAPAG